MVRAKFYICHGQHHESGCSHQPYIEQGRREALALAREAVAGSDLPIGDDLALSRARSAGLKDALAAIDALMKCPHGHDPRACWECTPPSEGDA